MRILLLDNYDSFTFNLLHLLEQAENVEVDVVRNDTIVIEEVNKYDGVVLSPGPGLPKEAGKMMDVLASYFTSKKILGVCLGHQAIGEYCGAELSNLNQVRHGVWSRTEILHPEEKLFYNFPRTFKSGLYHSWVISPQTLPDQLIPLAYDEHGNIMAIRHVKYPVWGVQFHPESILTEYGKELIFNWLKA